MDTHLVCMLRICPQQVKRVEKRVEKRKNHLKIPRYLPRCSWQLSEWAKRKPVS